MLPEESKIRKEYEKALAKAETTPFVATEEVIELYKDVVCGAVLVAEANANRIGGPVWQNAGLCRVMLRYGRVLERFSDHGDIADTLCSAAERMEDSLFDHPRLKAELVRFIIELLHGLECREGHDISSTDHFMEQLAMLERNIAWADSGQLDRVEQTGHERYDPVEWTELYENVIDDASRQALDRLKGHPRGLGFCHAYWSELGDALAERGVEWRSPALMNPHTLYD